MCWPRWYSLECKVALLWLLAVLEVVDYVNVMLRYLSSVAAPEVAKMTTFGAPRGENAINMTFPYHCYTAEYKYALERNKRMTLNVHSPDKKLATQGICDIKRCFTSKIKNVLLSPWFAGKRKKISGKVRHIQILSLLRKYFVNQYFVG